MSRIFTNVGANLLGRGVVVLATLFAFPIYLRFLGPEACGMLGFFQTLFVFATIFDLGVGLTFNKTLAEYGKTDKEKAADLLVTLEVVYVVFGLVLGVAALLFTKTMASSWFSVEEMTADEVYRSLQLMSLCLVVYWPYLLYSNGMMGIGSQVECNLIQVVMTVLRTVGAAFGVYFLQASLQQVFLWYAMTFLIQSAWSRIWLRMKLGAGTWGKFNSKLLAEIRKFAGGMGMLSLTAVVLMQIDKVILSTTLLLQEYGFYTLIYSLASSLLFISSPVFLAFFPVLSSAVARKDRSTLKREFLRGSSLMALLVIPVAAVLIFFSFDILHLWMGARCSISANECLVFSLLVMGFALNTLIVIPYALQLAYGWTRLNLVQNLIAISIFVPMLLLASPMYRSLGAAVCWFTLNLCYYVIGMPFVFRKVLRSEKRNWYVQATGIPLAIGLFLGGGLRLLGSSMQLPLLVNMIAVYLAIFTAIAALCRKEICWSLPNFSSLKKLFAT